MKTSGNPVSVAETRNNPVFRVKSPLWILLVVLLFCGSCAPTVGQNIGVSVHFDLPAWAPYYSNQNLVRYYYLPDIECYYDIMNREFIFLEDGQWVFSRVLPPAYAWFDLNTCFVVALNRSVDRPWRHFHYYLAHYPRYYYRSVFRDRYLDRSRHMRGFDENERSIVYNRREDMDNHPVVRKDEYRRYEYNRNEDNHRQEERRGEVRREQQERKAAPGNQAEPMKYYGREVGRPVKVQRYMKKASEPAARESRKQETRSGRQR